MPFRSDYVSSQRKIEIPIGPVAGVQSIGSITTLTLHHNREIGTSKQSFDTGNTGKRYVQQPENPYQQAKSTLFRLICGPPVTIKQQSIGQPVLMLP